ncbi:hypothetical protein F5B20DRAFT_583616 [Whalleya microplaca]|nr:hypothetical protein F5B20DRAFT_583616 [Whalleya microplaca]
MADSPPIIFYDIASAPPVTSFAPNPWKTRYALNFKKVNYRTEWVDLAHVKSLRMQLKAAPVRFFADGEPFYTLPIIDDQSTGQIIGDSFDIAVYLDKIYPDGPSLFPPSTIGLHAAFNKQVDDIFSGCWRLFVHGIPLNPGTADECKAEMERRSGMRWEDLTVQGEERRVELEKYKASIGELAKFFKRVDGPFLGGETVTYSDLIVGAWLKYLSVTTKEWEEIQLWHDGLWGRLNRTLQEKYGDVK